MNEIWKSVEINSNYEVSNLGRIRNVKRGTLLKISLMRIGYYCVNINNMPTLLHRLIGIAFIPNPHNKPTINHINGTKTDNRIDNLEWATYSENALHAFRIGLKTASAKGKFGYDNHSSKAIIQLDKNKNVIAEFGSMYDAMRKTGIQNRNISKVCNGERNFAGGFIWKFK